jgi:PAS domain S-box-containing protein
LNQIAIVSISDIQGNIIFANEMFSKISGYSNEELIGKNHRLLKSDQNDSALFDDLWKTIATGKTWRGDICNKNKFGELYWVDTLIVPFIGEDGKPEQYFAIRYEITEKKQQEHLQEANKILQKEKEIAVSKSKLKERFLANMSHEIRTPMNSILGLSNLMEKVGTLNPKQMDYIQTIKLNSKNLLNIINDILDLSKIEEGKLEMEHAEFDVFEIISQVEKSLHLAATNKNLDLITAIDTSVPRKIMGDSTRLNQVVTNLTNNAIKFTNEGSVCIEINTVQLDESNVTLRFSIKDSGIGIHPDKLKSIFEPFTQEKSSTTRLYGGTGLGLTISNEIIHAFGGQIEVKSSPDVGSEFYFIIAFEIPSYTIQKNCIDFKEENENIELFGKYTILLVEDNPFNQMVAEDTLKDWNGELEILIAENGEEALEKLKNQAFDLVLMDIQMPVMDGHIATQKARNELNISIPILAMTAQATPSEIEQCLLSGMNDYVSKPFDEKVLFSKIVKWIRSDLLL